MAFRPRRPWREELHEDYAYVLDFLPQGNPLETNPKYQGKPVAQVMGEKYFTLLEVLPRRIPIGRREEYIQLVIGEKVYIGKGPRDKVEKIIRRIKYENLTSYAKENLPSIVEQIVRERERVFVEFFNIAEPVTLKMHSLELLPGIGKRHMRLIIEKRKKKPFESFEDLQQRAKISDPVKIIVDRIIAELQGNEKYYIFVKPQDIKQAVYLGYLPRLYQLVEGRSEQRGYERAETTAEQ